MRHSKNLLFVMLTLIIAGVASRWFNVEIGVFHLVPVGAFALIGGYVIKQRHLAVLVPVLTMLISDVIIELTGGNGFYDWSQPFVYFGMAIFALLGVGMKKNKPLTVLGHTVLGSMLFWIISNFGVFVAGYYGFSFQGLMQTYTMALPFLKNDYYASSLFFNPLLVNVVVAQVAFGVYAYTSAKAVKLANNA